MSEHRSRAWKVGDGAYSPTEEGERGDDMPPLKYPTLGLRETDRGTELLLQWYSRRGPEWYPAAYGWQPYDHEGADHQTVTVAASVVNDLARVYHEWYEEEKRGDDLRYQVEQLSAKLEGTRERAQDMADRLQAAGLPTW